MDEPAEDQRGDDDLVAALAPLSLRSTLDGPSEAGRSGRPVGEAASVAALIAHHEAGLFDSPFAAPDAAGASAARRAEVATSVAFQAVVAQVANPVALAHRVLGVGLQPTLADVRWRAVGWGTRFGLVPLRRCEPQGLLAVLAGLDRDVIEPWLAIVGPGSPVPERTLRGNAHAALWTAVRAVDAHAPLTATEWDALATRGLRSGRDTCCLIHHAGLVACDECPRATVRSS